MINIMTTIILQYTLVSSTPSGVVKKRAANRGVLLTEVAHLTLITVRKGVAYSQGGGGEWMGR